MAEPARRVRDSIVSWSEHEVQDWISELGYPQYGDQIKEHGISGDILSLLDHEYLKEIGVKSVGQRLAILKAVYQLKIEQDIPIEPDAYIPPSEVVDEVSNEAVTIQKLWAMMGEQNERIKRLEQENQRLSETMNVCMEELATVSRPQLQGEVSLRKQPSLRWTPQSRIAQSPTRPTPEPVHESPRQSPHILEADLAVAMNRQPKPQPSLGELSIAASMAPHERPQGLTRNASNQSINIGSTSANGGKESKPNSRDGSDANPYKSFKVTLDDPCWKVLPAALKKYKISDDWQHYAMFICYGNTDRCLSYDEKPLLLFQKLKEANKNPVFTLRHIKDIRSPIAVAQQKQASRSAARRGSPDTSGATPRRPGLGEQTASSPSVPSYMRNTRLHQPPVLQPISARAAMATAAAQAMATPPLGTANSLAPQWPENGQTSATIDGDRPRMGNETATVPPEGREGVVYASTKSYAIAIYPYMAELDDEFDVSVHDAFIIIGRAKGWWIVQRDPTGTGILEENGKHSWVPAGCLLETSVPPATAVSEAVGRQVNDYGRADYRPILPMHLTSTSFSGVALRTYHVKGDEELELMKDEFVRVFKRYNHWSYAVKESNGERGWVPSWFIGKVSSAPPATPNTAMVGSSGMGPGMMDSVPESNNERLHANGHHASPLASPAFVTRA
ncbi:VTS1 RNA-binding family SAM domain protein [Ceratobasidium sp. AG-Ba]|nr:VTS1 RNA-binding family SAM domain protein [Ceratobasidium sp. AG-Ba]